jgi:hypothetical protein
LRDQLEDESRALFSHAREFRFQASRWVFQEHWKPFIEEVTAEVAPRFYFFTQNDDHTFIDFNTDMLAQGLTHMAESEGQKPLQTIYLSHNPEVLLLTGKLAQFNIPPERIGNFVRFNTTLWDAIQLVSQSWLRHTFLEVHWEGQERRRIDGAHGLMEVWERAAPVSNEQLEQTTYVPLREQCRKFAAYNHVGIPHNCVPPLAMPDCSTAPFGYDRQTILNRVSPEQCGWARPGSGWTLGNPFTLPEEWKETAIKLYQLKNTEPCVPYPWCHNSCKPAVRF